MTTRYYFLFLCILLFSCRINNPKGVDVNKLLAHYANDSLKQKAVVFLLDNLHWHDLQSSSVCMPDSLYGKYLHADSVIFHIVGGVNHKLMMSKDMRDWLSYNSRLFQKLQMDTTIVYNRSLYSSLSNKFIIDHVDNAFRQWHLSVFAQKLSFEDFCEYILPFNANAFNTTINGADLYSRFGKYFDHIYPKTLPNIVSVYKLYIELMRQFLGNKNFNTDIGWEEMFYKDDRDCIPQCELEVNVLRACGIPAAIDMNIGNREYVGRHHHCVVWDSSGKFFPFHGESTLSETENWGYALEYKLNIYRLLYGAQDDSPYMLKNKEEALPVNFLSPTIKDVTSYLKKTYPLELTWENKIDNNLVWLYTFSKEDNGVRAVTWGTVDSTGRTAKFVNVIPDVFYVLSYLDTNANIHYLTDPFFVKNKFNFNCAKAQMITDYVGNTDTIQELIVHRKFPRKPNMFKLAKNMVGGKFYGANKKDGSDKMLLYAITSTPESYLNEYKINTPGLYQYIIYEAPNERVADIALLEFLSDSMFQYTNVTQPTPLPILHPRDTMKKDVLVKVIPTKIDKELTDGNMQTASGRRKIVVEFPEQQVITHIRMAPKNADNGIKPEESYDLLCWKRNGWEIISSQISSYNYLAFTNLNNNTLYWLRNNTRGREEVPFIIVNNKPQFIYYDVMKSFEFPEVKKVDRTKWTLTVSSYETEKGPYEAGFPKYAIDANPNTFWHSQYSGVKHKHPHFFSIDMNSTETIKAVALTSRNRDIAKDINIEVSVDNTHWTNMGYFNMTKSREEQILYFEEPIACRYVRINFKNNHSNTEFANIAEVHLMK